MTMPKVLDNGEFMQGKQDGKSIDLPKDEGSKESLGEIWHKERWGRTKLK